VSTAFSTGERQGVIDNDYLQRDEFSFRNHYEKFKLKTEKSIQQYCEQNDIDYQILRPSIICGRLIDAPHFVVSKYLVFYLFGAFMYKMAKSGYGNEELRIQISPDSSMNIVPVDYVAKAILAASNQSIKQLNIVSTENISVATVAESIFKQLGIQNWKFVQQVPLNLNQFEEMYYKTIGKQFMSYMNSVNCSFDTSDLRKLIPNVVEPDVLLHFDQLLAFAIKNKFKATLS